MSKGQPVVLVIDDEAQIRRFLRAGLELENFTVLEAACAEEGLRTITLRPIDLIVVDLGLPDLDGSAIVERVRSWSTVPIIVLSVRSDEAEKVRLLGLAPAVARRRRAAHSQDRPSADRPWAANGVD
jgi:two-component system KDP operon response regulator KdpE